IEEASFFEEGKNNYNHIPDTSPWIAFFNNSIDFPIFPQVGTFITTAADAGNARNIAETINAVGRSHACGTINAYEAAALVAIGEASAGCENAPGLVFPPTPNPKGAGSKSSIASAVDPN